MQLLHSINYYNYLLRTSLYLQLFSILHKLSKKVYLRFISMIATASLNLLDLLDLSKKINKKV